MAPGKWDDEEEGSTPATSPTIAPISRRSKFDDEEEDDDVLESWDAAEDSEQEVDGSRAQAEELFGDLSISNKRAGKAVTITDEGDPGKAIDLSSLAIFNPNTKDQFTKLRETLTPLLVANSKKGQYSLFLQEFTKQIAKELPSEQIKKIASGLTTLSNEKMKEEKAAEKGGKKSKAAKTKTTLNASRDVGVRADTRAYDDEDFGDDDFM
ncbi:Eukaryotic translation initiation factor 3 protein [Pyrenophora tritici-repentis]|nr:Eukaryotic translation initiation factor 3 subunit J [Pyrenophora tritici-repentis]KAI0615414.1 Eukaryotic translation initiation factor 3 subunit J [Pyrenophora tritici-repentis]KAI0627471.1 Eukaryotic translation initiation factor 3 subunit J [Pyrenophora tritici-repentis]KAI2483016.1 Eukaryotic translation initiation factor 3 protein [Pyrenophora tritici-repentis]